MTKMQYKRYRNVLKEKLKKANDMKCHLGFSCFKSGRQFEFRFGYFEDLSEAKVFVWDFVDCYEKNGVPYITTVDGKEECTNIAFLKDIRN